ncbi:D-alanine--D-alanine ligase [Lachnospiraceae bacterium]|nr:D-alanine--D-alanine ligase [Lachnospiraceae bacterium]
MYAEKAFAALRLKNYARMDFMMNREGEVFCLEANTLPGMTPTSLLPQEAAAVGMSFGKLCEEILDAALRKHKSKAD